MRSDYLIKAIGCIDGALVDEAEDYRPKRKNHAWIWAAASAACVCFAVLMIFSRSFGRIENACLKSVVGAAPVHGYVDYRETAEQGKVTITDELKALIGEHEETGDTCKWVFSVHITDADGAGRFHIYKSCLEPLDLGEREAEDFLRDGTLTLSKKQIYSLKCPPECTVIVAPSKIALNREYLETVTLDTLNVSVYTNLRDNSSDDEEAEVRRIRERFDGYAEDNSIPLDGITEYYEGTGGFRAELDKETISRLLTDERTDIVYMITDG